MGKTLPIADRCSREMTLMLHLASAVGTTPVVDLETCVRHLQGEANESPSALQGPMAFESQHDPRIVRPGNAQEYLDSAMVGWQALRLAT
jgi:hypothetical protein